MSSTQQYMRELPSHSSIEQRLLRITSKTCSLCKPYVTV